MRIAADHGQPPASLKVGSVLFEPGRAVAAAKELSGRT
jgi:hypothetical protein